MSHRFVYFEARVNEAMKTVVWTWNGLMKIELEMVWWRLNLKWSYEDWTWNGLMKIELEMVSDEDWTWNGL